VFSVNRNGDIRSRQGTLSLNDTDYKGIGTWTITFKKQ